MTSDRIGAIQHAYAVFLPYRRKLTPTVAPWAAETERRKRMKHSRLRELTCEDVESVFWNATADQASFKHFLPRILECVACGTPTPRDLHAKLDALAFETWPDEERGAVGALLDP